MTSKKGGVAILVQRGIQYTELYPSNLQSLDTISTHQITEEWRRISGISLQVLE
jgi:hypothetical protein